MIGNISRGYCAAVVAASLAMAGCGPGQSDHQAPGSNTGPSAGSVAKKADEAEIQAARAALNPEDRALVAAQEYCAVMAESRLGSMGAPLKVMVKDQPVFVCCKGCIKKAEREADKTLARVAELKAKAKTDSPKP